MNRKHKCLVLLLIVAAALMVVAVPVITSDNGNDPGSESSDALKTESIPGNI